MSSVWDFLNPEEKVHYAVHLWWAKMHKPATRFPLEIMTSIGDEELSEILKGLVLDGEIVKTFSGGYIPSNRSEIRKRRKDIWKEGSPELIEEEFGTLGRAVAFLGDVEN